MKILVFSDSHLSTRFEERKFTFLKRVIEDADRVIINGDFWEGHLCTFDQFVNSRWKELFPLLLAKKTIYLYGNHDKEKFSDERVGLFSVKQEVRYELALPSGTYVFEHGDRICPLVKENDLLTRFIRVVQYTFNISEFIIFRYLKRFPTKHLYGRYNKQIKQSLKKELKPGEVFVCGHTHYAEFDLPNRLINSGFVRHGLAQYLIIENGVVTPKEEWYA